MFDQALLNQSVEKIHSLKPHFRPTVGIILGSGLGPLADDIKDPTFISYADLPGMPESTVSGHSGQLVLGTLGGVSVACLKGRVHYYEGAENHQFKTLIRLLKTLGCGRLIITNASGSLREHIGAGELVLVSDHINFQLRTPLLGPNEEEYGDRFYPMDEAYDKTMRANLHDTAKKIGLPLHDGIYLSVLGPNFETPAEIRAFRLLGADVIGMSTVPEVLVAKHCGLKVIAIATVTNLSADLNKEPITHEGTLRYGQMASGNLRKLVTQYLEDHRHEL